MSRSVSYPKSCEVVCFQDVSYIEDEWDWMDFIGDIQEQCQENWPSLNECDEWLDDEDHAILENQHCYIGVSEYCGIVSIWLRSKGEELRASHHAIDSSYAALADTWCARISKRFNSMCDELRLLGLPVTVKGSLS